MNLSQLNLVYLFTVCTCNISYVDKYNQLIAYV